MGRAQVSPKLYHILLMRKEACFKWLQEYDTLLCDMHDLGNATYGDFEFNHVYNELYYKSRSHNTKCLYTGLVTLGWILLRKFKKEMSTETKMLSSCRMRWRARPETQGIIGLEKNPSLLFLYLYYFAWFCLITYLFCLTCISILLHKWNYICMLSNNKSKLIQNFMERIILGQLKLQKLCISQIFS